jgi:hypothetical protein
MDTMVTREIPRSGWSEYFDAFSRRHDGWLVTIEVFDKELGAQVEAEERPLKGISAGRQKHEIEIITGGEPDDSLTRIIERPTRVQVEETSAGAEAAISIESEDEGTTLVRFRSAALPETVDGLADEHRS